MRLQPFAATLLVLTGLATEAAAIGQALGPDPREVWEGTMNYVATAGSLLECGPGTCELNASGNCTGRNSGTAALSGVPQGLQNLHVAYAQVTWVASLPQGQAPDASVTLTPPGGAPIAVMAEPDRSEGFDDAADANSCQFAQLLCGVENCGLTFASQVGDITEALNAHIAAGGALNGQWRIDDVEIPGGDDTNPQTAIAAVGSLTIGGWAVLVVFEDPSLPLRRLYYYQGFELISGGNRGLRPGDFLAPAEPAVDVTIFSQEGDEQTTGDSIRINGTNVEDGCNPWDNVFNDTVNSGGLCQRNVRAVDLDYFHLEDVIEPGDTQADIEIILPRGDGLVTAGEQIFTNWLMIAFDHRPPMFESLKPEKSAEPPSRSVVQPGDTIDYVILVENSGGDFATHVIVRDAPPPGTTYVPGTTFVDVVNVADGPDDSTLLARGLELTSLPGIERIAPNERHTVRFQVRVNDDTPDGTILTNIASISADGIDEVRTDAVQHSVGIAPDGGFPPPPDAALPEDMTVLTPPDAHVTPPDTAAALDAGPVICAPGEVVGADGRCRPESADAAPERDACAFAAAQGPCAEGTIFVEGQCRAICGEGTFWDPSCDNGCGKCKPNGAPTCAEAEGGESKSDGGCGCRTGASQSPAPLALLAVAALAVAPRRRRRRDR